ncbi:MAG TPA: cytochrome c [Rhodanobacteraceae bacterium]
MAVIHNEADRKAVHGLTIMFVLLGVAAVIEILIAAFVFASEPKASNQAVVQRAGERITPVSAVYSGAAGKAAVAAAAPSPAAASAAAPTGPYTYDPAKGKSLFDGTCAACHQATGEGIAGTFPPLKGNAVVNDANPAAQIETILFGRHGTVINGKSYPGAMPPFGGQFSDLQVADIANYERSSWGNHGKHITPTDVARIRAAGK